MYGMHPRTSCEIYRQQTCTAGFTITSQKTPLPWKQLNRFYESFQTRSSSASSQWSMDANHQARRFSTRFFRYTWTCRAAATVWQLNWLSLKPDQTFQKTFRVSESLWPERSSYYQVTNRVFQSFSMKEAGLIWRHRTFQQSVAELKTVFFFFWWRTEDSQEQRKQMKKWFSVQLNGWVDRARPWAGMRRHTWAESPAHTEQPTSHSELSDRWGSEKNSPSPYWVQDNRWMEAYVRLGSKACNVGPLELLPGTAQPNAVHRNKLNHKTRFLDPQLLKPV